MFWCFVGVKTRGYPVNRWVSKYFLVVAMALVASWPARPARADTAASALQVIPQPRAVAALGPGFAPESAQSIFVSDDAADRFAARLLQESIRNTHAIDCGILLAPPMEGWHYLWLATQASVQNHPLTLRASTNGNESYTITIDNSGAIVASSTETGLFYGTQTLMQMLEQARRDKTPLPGVFIQDWPEFDWRARYFDASQYFGSIVATRENLEREIKLLARFKMNWLMFDAYNFVPFQSFPACANANTLSRADWDYLVELAHQYHVTLVPSLQSFAQMYDVIWNCDAGRPYREATAPGLICPSRPENVQLLQGLYRDLIKIFKYSPVIGIGCSEVGMQWDNKYCPLCRARMQKGETYQDIFVKHIQDCAKAVEAAGREAGRTVRPLMWADEFYMGYNGKRWDGITNISTNMVMGHWKYWPDYDGMAGLLQRGFDVFFLSASYQHNIYLVDLSPQDPADGKWEPLVDSGIRNIAGQAAKAAEVNQKNLPGSVLGGGCATFSQHDIRCWDTTWFAYALQAEYSWGDPSRPLATELDPFTDNFAAIFYGARDHAAAQIIASAYRDLDAVKSDLERNNYLIRDFIGVYDVQDKCYNGNDLAASLKLINNLAAHPPGPGKTVDDIRQRSEHALEVAIGCRKKLAAVFPQVRNETSMQYLMSAPRKMQNHARLTLLLLDIAEASRKLDEAKDQESLQPLRQTLAQLQGRCKDLQADTKLIADQMDQLTRSGDASGYHKILASLAEYEKWLADAGTSVEAAAPRK